jgi:hypothetical protein
MKKFLVTLCILGTMLQANSWQKTFGGSKRDYAYSITQTKDGGYAVAGWTRSFGHKDKSIIVKLDKNGNKQWQKTFGCGVVKKSIIQTKDGGYAVAESFFGNGSWDMYIVKFDKNGNKIWQKTFGGSDFDQAYSITQTKDGGYALAGETWSFGNGEADIYIVKLDKNGNKLWQKTFGGRKGDKAYSITQTKDGGYVVAGETDSFGNGGDMYIVKLDKNGNKLWQKTFGGSKMDYAYSIIQTKYGGYVVAGYTEDPFNGVADIYIVKFDK